MSAFTRRRVFFLALLITILAAAALGSYFVGNGRTAPKDAAKARARLPRRYP
jgi:hypothetical protein